MPSKPPGTKGSSYPHAFTKEQVEDQLAFVERALIQRIPVSAMLKEAKAQFNIGRKRVDKLCDRVREKWQTEDADLRPSWKAIAIRSLERDMNHARVKLDKTPKAMHQTLLRYHALLADIQGTREPIEINVDVRISASVTQVIANMTSEEVTEHLARYRENKRLADEYRKRIGTTIDSAAE